MGGKKVTVAVTEIALPLARELGLEIVDVEYVKEGGRWFLRVFIDKPGGVMLDDCQALSEKLDLILDEMDPIPNSYTLEVSSPGIERPLKTVEDFKRFQNHLVKITVFVPRDGKKKFTGRLTDVSEQTVTLKIENEDVPFPMSQIASARLVAEIFGSKEAGKVE